ncbi:hypothetical protein PanWU01x14_210590 [Parasponia andersonii]|uniref:CLAVATA3/ESR (CLE)-related protein n=1 Tax=Parasponia andersonii TaxID=3476 RepID=A0A2P5BTT8_PARAD|nr:hypothetical protein PanWU01x14_210590 [Parasponia andersonii]
MAMSFRTWSSALSALVLIEILLCSSLCLCHEQINILQKERRSVLVISRKLLVSASSMATSFLPETPANKKNSKASTAAMKEPKKALEPSLRTVPPSVPNPTQNK